MCSYLGILLRIFLEIWWSCWLAGMTWWCLSIALAQPDLAVVGSLRQLNMMFERVSFGGEAMIHLINGPYSPSTFVIILFCIPYDSNV